MNGIFLCIISLLITHAFGQNPASRSLHLRRPIETLLPTTTPSLSPSLAPSLDPSLNPSLNPTVAPPLDFSFETTSPSSISPLPTRGRAIWLWKTQSLLDDPERQASQISRLRALGITDVFALLSRLDYKEQEPKIRAFNAQLNENGIQVWGMEGERSYFSDSRGPERLYAAAAELVAFNNRVPANARFIGFHTDIEPNDGQGEQFPTSFHNGIPNSALSTVRGGAWQATQAQDREMLMRDWLQIEDTLRGMLRPAGLKLGAAVPSWTDEYLGEEILVSYKGKRQSLMKHLMDILDDYVIMTYSTNIQESARRAVGETNYADSIPAASRPRVHASVDVHYESDPGTTYAVATQEDVLAAIRAIEAILNSHPSFYGLSIHDWDGWFKLGSSKAKAPTEP